MRQSIVFAILLLAVSCSNDIQPVEPIVEEVHRVDGAPLNAGSSWTYSSSGGTYRYHEGIWWPGDVTISHDNIIYQGKRVRIGRGATYFSYEDDGSTSHWVPMGFAQWETTGHHWINLPVTSKPPAIYSLDSTYTVYQDTIEFHATQRVEFLSEEDIVFEGKPHHVTKTLVETEYNTSIRRPHGSTDNRYQYSRFIIYWSTSLQLPVRVESKIIQNPYEIYEETYDAISYSLR